MHPPEPFRTGAHAHDDVDDRFRRFCGDGDAEALGAVFAATAPWLTRRAVQLTRDSTVALDLVQATFVTAIENRHRFDLTASARPWLHGILQQKARQHAARRVPAPAPADVPSAEDGPPTIAARTELAQLATRRIHDLPEPYRTVLQRALLHEETAEQIAAALGRSPATVRSQVRRGLDRLRRGLPLVLQALLRAFAGAPRTAGLAAAAALAAGAYYLAATTVPAAVPAAQAPADAAPGIAAAAPGASVGSAASMEPEPAALPRSQAAAAPSASPQREIEIRVVRAIGREPLAGVEVLVAIDGIDNGAVRTDARGTARLRTSATAAAATVAAPFASARTEQALQPAAAEAGVERFEPIELAIPPGFAVAGDVLDAAGQPAAAATVWRVGTDRTTQVATTDDRGRFLVLDLQPGREHRLVARRGEQSTATVGVIGTSGATVEQQLQFAAAAAAPAVTESPVGAADTTPLWLHIECRDGVPVHGWNAALLTTASDDVIAVQPVRGDRAHFATVPNGALRCVLLPPGELAAGNPRLLHRHHGTEPRALRRDGDRATLTLGADDLPSGWLQLRPAADNRQPFAERLVLLDPLGHPRGMADGSRELGPIRSGSWLLALIGNGHPIEYRGPLQVETGSRHVVDDLRAQPAAELRFTGAGGAPLAPPLRHLCVCAADAIVLLEPRRAPEDPLRLAPGDYVVYWQQPGRACSRLDLQVASGPQQIALAAAAGDEWTFVFDYASVPLAERTATFDLVVRDERATTMWRERVQTPLSDAGEVRLERRFAAPPHSVLAIDARGYRGHATAGRDPTVRVAMR